MNTNLSIEYTNEDDRLHALVCNSSSRVFEVKQIPALSSSGVTLPGGAEELVVGGAEEEVRW